MHHHHHLMELGAWPFFLFGFMGSLHCMGMCGPLSTLFLNPSKEGYWLNLASYQSARLVGYVAAGCLFYSIGFGIQKIIPFPILVWFVALPLLLFAFGVRLPAPVIMVKIQAKLLKNISSRHLFLRSILIGFFSPLLPCGLLYAALGSAVNAPNLYSVVLWMGSFALGTIPLLVLTQVGLGKTIRLISPRTTGVILRVLALVAALFSLYMVYFGHHS